MTFDLFWKEYPRRQDRKKARFAYINAVDEGANPDDILWGARAYARYIGHQEKTWTEGQQYVKAAHNWLNDENWADEWRYRSEFNGWQTISGDILRKRHEEKSNVVRLK